MLRSAKTKSAKYKITREMKTIENLTQHLSFGHILKTPVTNH